MNPFKDYDPDELMLVAAAVAFAAILLYAFLR